MKGEVGEGAAKERHASSHELPPSPPGARPVPGPTALPLRLAEYGQVYRWEESGAVGGLVRVRGMCMNDAHIYCTEAQIKDEFKAVLQMYQEAYAVLGVTDYRGAPVPLGSGGREGQGKVH